jgi:hypothetical protein
LFKHSAVELDEQLEPAVTETTREAEVEPKLLEAVSVTVYPPPEA